MYGSHSNSIQANCILLKPISCVRPLLIWWSWCEQQNKWNKNCGELTMVEQWQVRMVAWCHWPIVTTGRCYCTMPLCPANTAHHNIPATTHFTMGELRPESGVMINFTAVMRYFGAVFTGGDQRGMWTIAWPGADWAMSNSGDSSVIRMPANTACCEDGKLCWS